MPNAMPSLDTVFTEAIAIHDPEARESYLAQACGTDAALRRRVGALVAAHLRAGSFLDEPIGPADSTAAFKPDASDEQAESHDPHAGATIGLYTLREQIGEGGMGLVYVAEQTKPVRRKVALKLIKPGMDSKQVIARFEAERQALALMDHPNIARVLDGGATAEGRPFFVMELVRGIPITEYCDTNKLTVRPRLELLLQVCRAIQHAHQKGVIHRDLKPSNVLVTVHDVTAVAKVIDFGIAKAVGQQLTEKSVYTAFTQMVGTPLYMSPEQAGKSGLDVDTRTDVYSLGVLLYELLTGTTPIDPETLRKAGHDEVKRLIREDEPARPSARLSTLNAAALSTLAVCQGADPRRLAGQLRGELDWVVMKCLEKDRNRRYESASALASDIERFLADEPVEARAASVTYRARKFVRRHRVAVLAGSVIAASLVLGTLGMSVGLVRALRAENDASNSATAESLHRREAEEQRDRAVTEKKRADEEAGIARAANDFIKAVLAEAKPEKNPRGRKVSVEEVLDRAAFRIPKEFAGRPLVEAAIRITIGESYLSLGNFPAAAPHLERAAEIRRRELGEEHPDTLDALIGVAELYRETAQFDRAEPLLVQNLDRCRLILGADHDHTLTAMNNLALMHSYRGRHADAEELLTVALATRRRVKGETHPDTLGAMYALASVMLEGSRYKEAEPLLARVLEVSRRDLGADSHLTLAAMSGLAIVYDSRQDRAKSEPLFREVLEMAQRILGDEHPTTLVTVANVAATYLESGEIKKAEPLLVKAVEVGRRVSGADHPQTLHFIELLAFLYIAVEDYPKAAPLLGQVLEVRGRDKANKLPKSFLHSTKLEAPSFREMLEICLTEMANLAHNHSAGGKHEAAVLLLEEAVRLGKEHMGPDDPDTLYSMNNLAATYWEMKQLDKSIPLFEETLRRREKKLGRAHENTQGTVANLGVNYMDAGRLTEALPLLEEGYRASKRYPKLTFVIPKLLDAYEKAGKAPELAKLNKELLAGVRGQLPKNHPELAGQLAVTGLALLNIRAFPEAELLLRESLAIREKTQPEDWRTFNTRSMLGGALIGQKRYSEAAPLLLQGYGGMKRREGKIPAAGRIRLLEAADRLVEMYAATAGPAKNPKEQAPTIPEVGPLPREIPTMKLRP